MFINYNEIPYFLSSTGVFQSLYALCTLFQRGKDRNYNDLSKSQSIYTKVLFFVVSPKYLKGKCKCQQ